MTDTCIFASGLVRLASIHVGMFRRLSGFFSYQVYRPLLEHFICIYLPFAFILQSAPVRRASAHLIRHSELQVISTRPHQLDPAISRASVCKSSRAYGHILARLIAKRRRLKLHRDASAYHLRERMRNYVDILQYGCRNAAMTSVLPDCVFSRFANKTEPIGLIRRYSRTKTEALPVC